MGRIIAAVLAGYVAIGALVVITDRLFAALTPGFMAMPVPPLSYFYVSLATDSLYSVLGGFLCCYIARNRCRTATLSLIVMGELIGIAAQVKLWNTVPHWFGIALLVLYPLCVWFGSVLRTRTRPAPLPLRA